LQEMKVCLYVCMDIQSADSSGKQSYMGAIVSKVVDNVQIHVKNIHMRYEDGSSTPEVSYARRLEDKLR
jgi:vacuolar protein sorting-associated protein 13A/C